MKCSRSIGAHNFTVTQKYYEIQALNSKKFPHMRACKCEITSTNYESDKDSKMHDYPILDSSAVNRKQVRMYYRSGTGIRCWMFSLTRWQHFVTWSDVMDTVLKVWRQIENPTSSMYTMHIYLKNNSAKFYPDPVWNDRALGFFEEIASRKSE